MKNEWRSKGRESNPGSCVVQINQAFQPESFRKAETAGESASKMKPQLSSTGVYGDGYLLAVILRETGKFGLDRFAFSNRIAKKDQEEDDWGSVDPIENEDDWGLNSTADGADGRPNANSTFADGFTRTSSIRGRGGGTFGSGAKGFQEGDGGYGSGGGGFGGGGFGRGGAVRGRGGGSFCAKTTGFGGSNVGFGSEEATGRSTSAGAKEDGSFGSRNSCFGGGDGDIGDSESDFRGVRGGRGRGRGGTRCSRNADFDVGDSDYGSGDNGFGSREFAGRGLSKGRGGFRGGFRGSSSGFNGSESDGFGGGFGFSSEKSGGFGGFGTRNNDSSEADKNAGGFGSGDTSEFCSGSSGFGRGSRRTAEDRSFGGSGFGSGGFEKESTSRFGDSSERGFGGGGWKSGGFGDRSPNRFGGREGRSDFNGGGFGENTERKERPSGCFNCKQEGHRSSECPLPKNNACYNCGSEDHLSRECTNPPKTRRIENDEVPKKPPSTFVPKDEDVETLFKDHIEQGEMFTKLFEADVTLTEGGLHGRSEKGKQIKSFDELELTEQLANNVTSAGYKHPTPIQQYAMPAIFKGRDIMACAQTGSGKTAAFLLPVMTALMRTGNLSNSAESTCCPSATFPPDVQEIAAQQLKSDFLMITIGKIGVANKCITQEIIECTSVADKKDKFFELLNIDLKNYEISKEADVFKKKTMVFVSRKLFADTLGVLLSECGIPSTTIHGDRFQNQRAEAINEFKRGKKPVLIATAVGERGLDIKGVDHVINYDLPTNGQDYVHRIGRTGRVGNPGRATSLYLSDENKELAQSLVEILTEAEQDVPEFLANDANGGSSRFAGFGRFGGGDEANNAAEEEDWD
ncbi:helicase protein [Teladorsagia circumcincta]|uniref:RNA helicase n=1 Tax=Teladorsagia circumcincta TaxID=45464 RepID=A0A2G9V483_TELCI|nr:helicase protein [Teladorsagia circumcincta]